MTEHANDNGDIAPWLRRMFFGADNDNERIRGIDPLLIK